MAKKIKDISSTKFEDLPNIGPITAAKLRKLGVQTIYDILIMGGEEISTSTGMKREDADVLVQKVLDRLAEQGKLPKFSNTADVVKFQKSVIHLPVGCSTLDQMLRGGVETKSLTEIYGAEGAGKTQYTLTLAVETLKNGFDIAIIDCENTFDFERFEEIAKVHGLEVNEELFNRIHIEVTPDTHLVRQAIMRLPELIQKHNIKLVLVDGIIGVFRMESDQGRGVLADRQNHIKHPIRHLKNIALYLDCAVLFTNQVLASPDMYSGETDKAIGGHIFGHSVKYIIKFNKGSKNKRIAHFKKSNKDPQYDCEFYLTEAGVSAPEDVDKDGIFKKKEKTVELHPESELIDKSLLIEGPAL